MCRRLLLCRMVHENPPRLTAANRDRLIAIFRSHLASGYKVIPVDGAMYTQAANLCREHPLRAYDAVQFAYAITTRDDAAAIGATPPTFVCADTALLAIAKTEGLAVENPNDRP